MVDPIVFIFSILNGACWLIYFTYMRFIFYLGCKIGYLIQNIISSYLFNCVPSSIICIYSIKYSIHIYIIGFFIMKKMMVKIPKYLEEESKEIIKGNHLVLLLVITEIFINIVMKYLSMNNLTII